MSTSRSGLSLWIAGAASMLALGSAAVRSQALPDYKLHPGDKVIIGVYDDPKLLPQQMTVAPDGRISYPMVGELMAGGKTVEQVRLELNAKLKKYLSDAIDMNPTINVLQALSIAGGANPYAKLDSIIVIRSSGGAQRVLPFKYGQVSTGKELQQNIQLESGDVVVVP
jgi:polysaccharide export outer membrane protein